jgi:hypothetical protein
MHKKDSKGRVIPVTAGYSGVKERGVNRLVGSFKRSILIDKGGVENISALTMIMIDRFCSVFSIVLVLEDYISKHYVFWGKAVDPVIKDVYLKYLRILESQSKTIGLEMEPAIDMDLRKIIDEVKHEKFRNKKDR